MGVYFCMKVLVRYIWGRFFVVGMLDDMGVLKKARDMPCLLCFKDKSMHLQWLNLTQKDQYQDQYFS